MVGVAVDRAGVRRTAAMLAWRLPSSVPQHLFQRPPRPAPAPMVSASLSGHARIELRNFKFPEKKVDKNNFVTIERQKRHTCDHNCDVYCDAKSIGQPKCRLNIFFLSSSKV